MVYLLGIYRLLLQQAGGDEPSVLSYNVCYSLQEKNGDAIRKASIFFLEDYKERNFFSLAVSGDLFSNLFLINALDMNK
jgi:hypothetical protein